MSEEQKLLQELLHKLEQLRDLYKVLSSPSVELSTPVGDMTRRVYAELSDAIDNGIHDSSIAWVIKQLEYEQ